MWLVLLPLPWLLMGLLAADIRRPGRPGCVFIGAVFIWPQVALLHRLGISLGLAWAAALALMVIFPILGYLLGMRLFPPSTGSAPPTT